MSAFPTGSIICPPCADVCSNCAGDEDDDDNGSERSEDDDEPSSLIPSVRSNVTGTCFDDERRFTNGLQGFLENFGLNLGRR